MIKPEWTSKEWHNNHFPENQLDLEGDTWGKRWRGMEKMRYETYLKLIKEDLQSSHSLKILDIGCALCDFTVKAWELNRNNQIWGMDISDNAIAWVTENFPNFNFKTAAIPDIPFDVKFDIVLCLETLYYTDQKRKTLENIRDSLVPSGMLVFSGNLNARDGYFTVAEQFRVRLIETKEKQVVYVVTWDRVNTLAFRRIFS